MTLSQTIQATLIYHDLFDYPLTPNEIHQYLIEKKATLKSVEKELKKLKDLKKISENQGYWFLRGRSKIVSLRFLRRRYSQRKIKKAIFFSNILKIIPHLELIAVSGALAMENSHKNDDIDLVLVTAPKRLWTTRFLANILLWPFKRDRSGKRIANKACLNLFIDKSNLKIDPPNLYLAHEICQAKPLWDKNNTYQKFLKANGWVKEYLPNWQLAKVESRKLKVESLKKKKFSILNSQFSILENSLKNFQMWYMRPKITTEKIGKTQLFFHPKDSEKWVMSKYRKRLGRLKINPPF